MLTTLCTCSSAVDAVVLARQRPRVHQPLPQRLVEDLVDQRALARPGRAGDRHEHAERERHVHRLEVVLPRAAHHERLAVARFAAASASRSTACRRGTGPSAMPCTRARRRACPARPPCRRARPGRGPSRRRGRRRESCPRRARRRSPCCRCRAGSPASRSSSRCPSGAGRCSARRARRASPSAPTRSAWKAGSAATRRRRACRSGD